MLKKYYVLILVPLIIALAAGAVAGYYYNRYQNAQSVLKNPNLAVEKETKQLINQVGKLLMLPKDETPTVATVTDAPKLKNQPFFKNAKNGDKVLIYVKARKAILFDPKANIIIDVAPVNVASNTNTPTPSTGAVSATPKESPKVTQPVVVTPKTP